MLKLSLNLVVLWFLLLRLGHNRITVGHRLEQQIWSPYQHIRASLLLHIGLLISPPFAADKASFFTVYTCLLCCIKKPLLTVARPLPKLLLGLSMIAAKSPLYCGCVTASYSPLGLHMGAF